MSLEVWSVMTRNNIALYAISALVISAVRDSNGKVIEAHTYDSQGKGLTSSRAGGVDAVTISYPQPPPAVASTN